MGKRNPVARFALQFNRATVEVDRKKRIKRGYVKHKGQRRDTEALGPCFLLRLA